MWRDWGTWSVEGMSWEQVWDKYENQILQEMMDECEEDVGSIYRYCADDESEEECCIIDLDESSVQEEITAQICLRILERSCGTNPVIDRIFLREDGENDNVNIVNHVNQKESTIVSGDTPMIKKRIFSKLSPDNSGGNSTRSMKRKRRRRNAERDLARIRNQLEKDMQDLLQLSHEYNDKK